MSTRLSSLRVLAAAGALLVGGAASAEPITVEYFIDQKAFKSGATATDQLTFELFSDAQCTASIAVVQHFVGDTTIQYYVDKRQAVAGGVKPPKTVRLRAVIDGPTTSPAPYLMVTGPGVVPVGGACQVQAGAPVAGPGASGPQGPPGPEGLQGASGPAGATGAQGSQGISGPAGTDGADGAVGAQGLQGLQGEPGQPGADGADGTSGSLIGGIYFNLASGSFLSPLGSSADGNAFLLNEFRVSMPVSSGTASKLVFAVDDPVAIGGAATLTLRKNGVDTVISCTIPEQLNSCTDLVHSVTFADGDFLTFRYDRPGTTQNFWVRFSTLYQAP